MKKPFIFVLLFVNMSVFAQAVNEKLIPFQDNQGKWGYLDADSDKIVIPTKYDFANLFENGIALVGTNNPKATTLDNKYLKGYIHENGEEILPINFTGIYEVNDITQTDSIFKNLKHITFESGTNGILKLPEGKWLVEPGKYKDFKFYKSDRFVADNMDFYDDNKKYTAPKDCKIKFIDFKNRFFKITKGENEPNEGISNWEGKIIVAPKYIEVQFIKDIDTKRFLATTIKGKITPQNFADKNFDNYLLDENGNQIITFKSEKIPFINDNYVATANYDFKNEKYYINLLTGHSKTNSTPYSNLPKGMNILLAETPDYKIFQDNKTRLYGYKNNFGSELIKPIYDKLEVINNECIVATKQDLTGVFDMLGNKILPFEYDFLETSQGNLIGSKNGKYGRLSFQGKEIIKFIFEYTFHFEDDLAIVHTENGAGVIDKFGNSVIPNEFKTLSRTNDGKTVLTTNLEFKNSVTYFTAEKDKKYGLFDISGKLLIPFEYGYLRKANNDKFFLKGWIKTEDLKRKKSGLVNIITNATILPVYDGIEIFDTFLIANNRVDNNYFYQLLNLDGKPISEIIYDEMKFTNGYFIVSKNKKEGIMNVKGEIIVPLKFNYIWSETPNLIRIWDNERYYYINVKSGKEYKIND